MRWVASNTAGSKMATTTRNKRVESRPALAWLNSCRARPMPPEDTIWSPLSTVSSIASPPEETSCRPKLSMKAELATPPAHWTAGDARAALDRTEGLEIGPRCEEFETDYRIAKAGGNLSAITWAASDDR